MKKKFYLYILTFIFCTIISGCGKLEIENSSNSGTGTKTPSDTSLDITPDVSKDISSNVTSNNNIPEQDIQTQKPGNDESKDDNSLSKETPIPEDTHVPEETPVTKKAAVSASMPYSDTNRSVTFLGLKEYKKIKGETYTDTPQKNKKYLVLFLSIKNNSNEENYINYNYFKAKLDGKEIEHTFLLNDPKGYPTIFTHLQSGGNIAGFIAWEVPNKWKKLEITYNGWKDTDNISLDGSFTPGDLSDPLIYNSSDYLNNGQN